VATSSHRAAFELKTARHGEIFSLFDAVVCGDDPEVTHGKPEPDIFLAAARRLPGGPYVPSEILVFEDAHNGVQAALAAGMRVCWVPDPRALDLPGGRDGGHGAHEVLLTLEDFRPERFALPAFAAAGGAEVREDVVTGDSFAAPPSASV
ncbi:MAG: pseudouridine-5'-monophosphatase-like protein, partial [Olpidium bornovanus]